MTEQEKKTVGQMVQDINNAMAWAVNGSHNLKHCVNVAIYSAKAYAAAQVAEKDTEIQSLQIMADSFKSRMEFWKGLYELLVKEITRPKAENEALQNENAEYLKKAVAALEPLAIAYCDIRDLKTENERMREAMEKQSLEMSDRQPQEYANRPQEAPAPDVLCPDCGSRLCENIGVGIHAGTLYKCWECKNEFEDEL